MVRKSTLHKRLLVLLYIEANPGCIAHDIVRDIFKAERGENSKCRHAYLFLREMNRQGFIPATLWKR